MFPCFLNLLPGPSGNGKSNLSGKEVTTVNICIDLGPDTKSREAFRGTFQMHGNEAKEREKREIDEHAFSTDGERVSRKPSIA